MKLTSGFQEPSLHLVPSQQPTASHVSLADTASSLGPHDALAHGGPRSIASEVANKHPLQNRLAQVSVCLPPFR